MTTTEPTPERIRPGQVIPWVVLGGALIASVAYFLRHADRVIPLFSLVTDR
ncbi:MAG: hypothetical protein K2X99_02755 [Gemmatimonadaceae bacterium]|nr:hypothetical protein [Gemmatimonadaceae bacterium]